MSIYQEYQREPSIPHQCMHHSDKDGHRCRGRAMHNEIMCFHHRTEDIPTVLQNDPFDLPSLYDRASIQHVLTQVASRLAVNHMDLKRAALLLQSCQIASTNLTAHERAEARAQTRAEAAPHAAQSAVHNAETSLNPHVQRPEQHEVLDPTPDPEALKRHQARRAELELDDEDDPAIPPATQNPVILSEDARMPPVPRPWGPGIDPATTPLTAQSSQLTARENPTTPTPTQHPANILPTLQAVAAPIRTKRAEFCQNTKDSGRRAQHHPLHTCPPVQRPNRSKRRLNPDDDPLSYSPQAPTPGRIPGRARPRRILCRTRRPRPVRAARGPNS